MDKRGSWSTPKIVLTINHIAHSVIVPDKSDKCVTVAAENVQKSIAEEPFAYAVQSAIDTIDETIEHAIPDVSEAVPKNSDADTERYTNSVEDDADFSEILTVPAPDNGSETVNQGDRVQIYYAS